MCTSFLPITTKFSSGLPPCLFSSSALTSIVCLPFPEERPGVGAGGGSSPFDPLDGVSGRLDEASEAALTAVLSGLPPRRTWAAATPFSPALRREHGGPLLQSDAFCTRRGDRSQAASTQFSVQNTCSRRGTYLGTSKPIVCFLPETVIRATLGRTSDSSLV